MQDACHFKDEGGAVEVDVSILHILKHLQQVVQKRRKPKSVGLATSVAKERMWLHEKVG